MRKKICMILGGMAAGVALIVIGKKLHGCYHDDIDNGEWDEFFDGDEPNVDDEPFMKNC